jgi:5-methylcytosine-specific restriction endonuclease McrA
MGARARARIRAGGPTSIHRAALDRAGWRALVAHCVARQAGRCLGCHAVRPLDPHHVQKRSQGGPDTAANVVMLCRPCHDRTDWPTHRGKLVITVVGPEAFVADVVWTPEAWRAARYGIA